MSLVVRAQLRFLWLARGSMLSALLGMTIGVASVVGVHLLSAQVALRVSQQAQPVGAVDVYLQKADLADTDYFVLRARWRGGELPEVAALFPLLEGEVTLENEPHLLVGTDPLAAGGFRASPLANGQLEGGQVEGGQVEGGQGEKEGAVESLRLDQTGKFFSVDSVILPRGSQPVASVQLNGHEAQVLGYTAPVNTVLADLASARSIFSQAKGRTVNSTRLTRIGVRFVEDAKPGSLVSAFLRKLFPGALNEPEAKPLAALDKQWQQTPAANQNPTQQLLRAVLFNVAALSVLALVVAWLLTFQVACHALGRRQGMFERLQSLGVSRRRLRGLTQVEGLILGAAATLLGVGLGLFLANLLLSLALGADFGLALGLSEFVWLKAVVSGVGVAGLSYWFAANQALFALPTQKSVVSSPDSIDTKRGMKGLAIRWTFRWSCPAGLFAVFLWGLWGSTLVGAFACIVVSALILIIYLPALVDRVWQQTLTAAGNLRGSTLNLLALRQVLVGRELRLGVSALALALATALGISIMVDSFRGAFLQMLDQRLADDVVVRIQSANPAGSGGEDVVRGIAAESSTHSVEAALRTVATDLYWRGTASVSVCGVSGRAEFSDNPLEFLDRFFPGDAGVIKSFGPAQTAVYVNESFARLQNLEVGQSMELKGRGETLQASVAGIFTDFGEVRPRLLVSQALAQRLDPRALLTHLYVRLPPETPALATERVRDALGDLATQPWLRLQDQAQVQARSMEIFEQTFAITRALTWLALLVAAVALANAIAANDLQQQGTARQLRVLGVGKHQARKLRYEGTFYVAFAAVALAVPLGLVIAALLCLLVNPIAFGWSFPMRLTFSGVAWPLVGGSLGALFASLLGDALAGRHTQQSRRSNRSGSPGMAVGIFGGVISVSVLMLLSGCGSEGATDGAVGKSSGNVAPAPAMRVGSVLGGDSQGFARATKVVPFVFPRDHGAHPEFRSEWWYLTCPLRVPDKGSEVGVQFTLFRQALVPPVTEEPANGVAGDAHSEVTDNPWRTGQLYMAHAALTDVDAEQHSEVSRWARGHPALAGVRSGATGSATQLTDRTRQTDVSSFAAWLEDWRLEAVPDETPLGTGDTGDTGSSVASAVAGLDKLKLQISNKKFRVSLTLVADKPLVLQGDRGLSYKGSSEASYYYSLPRLTAQGVIAHLAAVDPNGPKRQPENTQSQRYQPVEGSCWLDREWSTSVLADSLAGWDWFALQFDDNTELMLFQLRASAVEAAEVLSLTSADAGSDAGFGGVDAPKRMQGKRIAVDGVATTLRAEELEFQPLRYWQDETGVRWPIEWHIRVGPKKLRVVAALDDQRMRSSIAYWEGLVWIYEDERRVGQGYLEMTGYST